MSVPSGEVRTAGFLDGSQGWGVGPDSTPDQGVAETESRASKVGPALSAVKAVSSEAASNLPVSQVVVQGIQDFLNFGEWSVRLEHGRQGG